MRLKINDIVLDNEQDEVISQTLEVCSFENISTRNGDFTNSFKLPLTPRNRQAIGFIDDFNNTSRNQYIKLEAYLVDGSNEYKGYVKLSVISYGQSNWIEGTFFGSNSDWFNEIKDKTMKELDLSEFNHSWNETEIITAIEANGTLGYDYTLIDYGRLKNYEGIDANLRVTTDFMYPQMKVETLVRAIFKDIGWIAQGTLFNQERFINMVQPFCAEEFSKSPEYIKQFTKVYNAFFVPDLDTDLQSETIQWAVIPAPLDIEMNVDSATYYKMTYSITWMYTRTSPVGGLDVTFKGTIANNGAITNIWSKQVSVDNLETYSEFTYTVDVFDNPFYLDDLSEIFSGLSINFSGGEQGVLSVVDASYSFTPTSEYLYNDSIDMASTMPEMSQKDFLKHILFSFGVIPQSNVVSKTVSLNLFNEIKENIPNAVDWSSKIDVSKTYTKDFTKLLNNYSKSSKIKYSDDNEDAELRSYKKETGVNLGDGSIDIDNQHLPDTKTIYTSMYSPCVNINALSNTVNIPQIKWQEFNRGVLEKALEVNPKILLRSNLISLSELSGGTYDTLVISKDHGAKFSISVLDGEVDRIEIIQGSQYEKYTSPIVVIASPPESDGGVRAVIDITFGSAGFIRTSDVTILDRGSGYINPPELTLVTPAANFDATTAVSYNWFVKTPYIPPINNIKYNLSFGDTRFITGGDRNLKEDYLFDFQTTLNDIKGSDAYFRLNELDINNIDYLIPIYVDIFKSYFYINKIPDYRGVGSSTKVEIIKIG